MKIKNITITDIGGIQSLSLDFDDRMNIISGPNSIGKTTVLECIGHIFSNGNTQILKKRAGTISGRVSGHVLIDGKEYDTALKIDTFEPSKISSLLTLYQYSDKLLVLKSARTWGYQSLTAIHPDKTRTIGNNSQYAQHGINSTEVKAWLVNRFL
ncbi:MAG: AAA family ATPase, partial [Candidatus Promineifilaceae bacterium]